MPVDSSGYSFAAIDLAVDLAARLDARIVGTHVAESGGSASYLDLLEECCRGAAVPFLRRTFDGRSHTRILQDVARSHYDLLVMGALGEGAVQGSQIGSVAERVARQAATDVLLVKDLLPDQDGPILAAVDGSRPSLEALGAALALGRATGRVVEGIVVGEDWVAGQASAALDAARRAARDEGAHLDLRVAEGKPFDRILGRCAEMHPWLLTVGRTGTDAEDGDDIGSTAGNLIRLAACNVLLAFPSRPTGRRALRGPVERRSLPEPQDTGSPAVIWSEEAKRLLEDVPAEQRAEMIRTVEDGARRLGVPVITSETIDKVMLGYIDS